MSRLKSFLFLLSIILFVSSGLNACTQDIEDGSELIIFAGSISKPVLEEISSIYEQESGMKPVLIFGGSGAMLSQMKLARYGDIYIPASSDFMEKAKAEGLVLAETERVLAYVIPAINVQKGNPRDIRELQDLARPGLKVAIANPGSVVIGLLAREILERNGMAEEIAPNIVAYAESAEKLQAFLALKAVDAVIGWRDFQNWAPQYIDTILFKPGQLNRISYISASVSSFTSNESRARGFLSFLTSDRAREVFLEKGYIIREDEALQYISRP